MTPTREFAWKIVVTLLLLLLHQDRTFAHNTAESEPGVVTVHMLEQYSSIATAFQVGTYKTQDGWRLIFFKAHSLSSGEGKSCFRAPPGLQAFESITNQSNELKSAFCATKGDFKENSVNVVSYSYSPRFEVSVLRTNTMVPDTEESNLRFQFEALDVREWQ